MLMDVMFLLMFTLSKTQNIVIFLELKVFQIAYGHFLVLLDVFQNCENFKFVFIF